MQHVILQPRELRQGIYGCELLNLLGKFKKDKQINTSRTAVPSFKLNI